MPVGNKLIQYFKTTQTQSVSVSFQNLLKISFCLQSLYLWFTKKVCIFILIANREAKFHIFM